MNETLNKGRATYKTMAASTKDDWAIISDYAKDFNQNLSFRILDHLRILKDGEILKSEACMMTSKSASKNKMVKKLVKLLVK